MVAKRAMAYMSSRAFVRLLQRHGCKGPDESCSGSAHARAQAHADYGVPVFTPGVSGSTSVPSAPLLSAIPDGQQDTLLPGAWSFADDSDMVRRLSTARESSGIEQTHHTPLNGELSSRHARSRHVTSSRQSESETISEGTRMKPERPCPKCGKVFANPGYLSKHIRLVHSRTRTFVCKECPDSRSFGQRSDLVRHHKAVHLKLKPFKCPICSNLFSNKANMKSHMTGMHPDAYVKYLQACVEGDHRDQR
ncbi:Zinc finger protein [Porphyridium purpureum]|uniref:Zinc finger protein n=1 Tax=Porphyridium purpureum TaxID=35688 RepID=A0A5J4YPA3_PORPP|nr:Zinc finger protein [Porphyridium purpureum]|eukprot:POR0565..scf295_9